MLTNFNALNHIQIRHENNEDHSISLVTIVDTDSKWLLLVHCDFDQYGTDCKRNMVHVVSTAYLICPTHRAYPQNKLKVICQFYICQDIACKKY